MKDFFRSNKKIILFGTIIFLFCFLFFVKIHPLVISDTDDWLYFGGTRKMIPVWRLWNPAKVLPEVLFSLMGSISTYIVYPLTNDYFGSITIVSSILVSIFITVFISLLVNLLIKKYKISDIDGIMIGSIIFLLNFLLCTKGTYYSYLFYTHDLNCYYNYLIPNLLCFIIIFIFSTYKIDYSIKFPKNYRYGLLILMLYFAIFSNLYSSIILAVYFGFKLLENIIKTIKKFKPVQFIKDNFLLILTLGAWPISAFYEYFGGRAQDSVDNGNLITSIKECIKGFIDFIKNNINTKILILIIIIFVLFIINYFIDNKRKKNEIKYKPYLCYLFCIIITTIYLVLLCSKVYVSYVQRIDCMFGTFEFILILLSFCIAYLIKKYPKIVIVIPFFVAYSIVQLNNYNQYFYESNIVNLNPEIFNTINNDIVDQIKEGVKEGKNSFEVYVPNFPASDNFPYATYAGDYYVNTLINHNIINKYVSITIIPSDEKSKELDIYYEINK